MLSLLSLSCTDQPIEIEFLAVPAAPSSGQVSVTLDDNGQPLLSWVEPEADQAALVFSRFAEGQWQSPTLIAQGSDWFVNWADFPAIGVAADGRWIAHWLRKSAAATYAYDIATATSSDAGVTWTRLDSPHRDATPTEHGFVSYFRSTDGHLGMAWLDGRNTIRQPPGPMSLRTARFVGDWRPAEELDARVCDCCQTDAALTSQGPVVVYRDRTDDETRDIAIVRQRNGRWSEPAWVHRDDWQIEACPVNGPAIAAKGQRVAVAWFTMADGVAAVKLVSSADAGASFGDAIELDQHRPLGRVDVGMLSDGRVVVVWLETDAFDETRIQIGLVADSAVVARTAIGQSSSTRASGFPRLVVDDDDALWLAWREMAGDNGASRLRSARLRFR